jgi:hypothetical protein
VFGFMGGQFVFEPIDRLLELVESFGEHPRAAQTRPDCIGRESGSPELVRYPGVKRLSRPTRLLTLARPDWNGQQVTEKIQVRKIFTGRPGRIVVGFS